MFFLLIIKINVFMCMLLWRITCENLCKVNIWCGLQNLIVLTKYVDRYLNVCTYLHTKLYTAYGKNDFQNILDIEAILDPFLKWPCHSDALLVRTSNPNPVASCLNRKALTVVLTDNGAAVQISLANFKLSSIASSATLLTRPIWRASWALITRPVINRSAANAGPMSNGAKCRAAIPGCSPSLLNVKPMVAFVDATLRSQPPTAKQSPAPIAGPLIAKRCNYLVFQFRRILFR